MSNPTASRTDGTCEPSPAHAPQEQLIPRLPLGFGASSSDNMLPHDKADPIVSDAGAANRLNERDIELIDFLVRKAVESCMPVRQQPPLPPGARARSTKAKR